MDTLTTNLENLTENEREQLFRTHILRMWSQERTDRFCLHLLGDKVMQLKADRDTLLEAVRAAYQEVEYYRGVEDLDFICNRIKPILETVIKRMEGM
jgi:hypothetical protein